MNPFFLVPLDAILCLVILSFVAYTEIDWVAYIQQVEAFLRGERDYALIRGQTGALVYPAGHVYAYSAFYSLTHAGKDIIVAQILFMGLYLLTLTFTIAAYKRTGISIWGMGLLVLSKRVHSIYLLRLFNDGLSACFMAISTYCLARHWYFGGTVIYSLALGVKMNALLYLPGLSIILVQAKGIKASLRAGLMILMVQVGLAAPFLMHEPRNYVARAFDLSRKFMYKWTVNWRFIDIEIFESREFAIALLVGHIGILLVFARTRWLKPTGLSLITIIRLGITSTLGALFPTDNDIETVKLSTDFILTTLFTSNLIGIVFARSLHYQFYAWFAWTTPFMLYKTKLFFPAQVLLWVAQEWAWNVYPSTPLSSAIVVAIPAIVLTTIWFATANEYVPVNSFKKKHYSSS